MRKNIITIFILLFASIFFQENVPAASLVSAKKTEITIDPKKIEAEREALWQKIGEWCAISAWHPSMLKCVEKKEGDQVLRLLTFKDGNTSKEKLLERGATSYKYEILETTLPVQNYQSMFSVAPDDEDLDELNIQWSATFDPKNKDDKEVRSLIEKILAEGIANLKSKFESVNVHIKDKD